MITAAEIRKKALHKYPEVVKALLAEASCFPLEIRSNKVLSKDFARMQLEIAEVYKFSRHRRGYGYVVQTEAVKTRQHGIQNIPKAIVFEDLTDYLKFVDKEKETTAILRQYALICKALPRLGSWLRQHPLEILEYAAAWPELITVCRWFVEHHEPDQYYIRELPVPVHTKFIESHKTILRPLLDQLIPQSVQPQEGNFEKRFGLKSDPVLIRFRRLDLQSTDWPLPYDDLTVPVEQFAQTPLPCRHLFIIENKMNFLAFPCLPGAIAIWGKGFALDALQPVSWLRQKNIRYWSDLDAQGFQMLARLRSLFPQTQSFLMDLSLLQQYAAFIVPGTPLSADLNAHLTPAEQAVYAHLIQHNHRLEQERIHQNTIIAALHKEGF